MMKKIKFIIWSLLFLSISCSKKTAEVVSGKKTLFLTEVDDRTYRIDKYAEDTDPAITAMIAPYKVQVDATMDEVIGKVEKDMYKQKPNSALNNWVADVLLAVAQGEITDKVDFAVQNYGGIRVPNIAAGELSVRKIFELMPFENKLTIIKANGKIVQELMDRIADYGGWPISKGLYIEVKDNKAVKVMINGSPLDMNATYIFALPDYIANGGDNCDFLNEGERTDLDLLIRDGIIEHLRSSGGNVAYNDEKRIKTYDE